MSTQSGQVVLVTGCSTGIGRALVLELAARGHRPFATARRLETIRELAERGIETLRLDVNAKESIAEAVETIRERAGRIDVLVNNAGQNAFGPLLEIPLEKVRATFETNVFGLLAMSQAVFPMMAARRTGRIVNIGSVVGVLPTPFAGVYCASKSAVHMVSEVMRMEAAPFGIDVVVVQPGGVKSSIADNAAGDIARFKDESSLYHRAYAGIEKRAFMSQDSPMPAEDFAREVIDAALATPAPRVVLSGTGAEALVKFAEAPPEKRDAALSKNYLLDRLP